MKKILAFTFLLAASLNFAHAQDSLKYSRGQVAADIAFFIKNAAEIHPNLYHDISKTVLTVKIDSLVKTLPDSLSDLQTFRAFAEATAFINEGHTGINTSKPLRAQRKSGTFRAIPLQVTDYNNIYFSANLLAPTNRTKGIKVTAINGVPSTELFKRIIALKGGLASFRKVSAITNFRFYLAAIGIKQPYAINYLDADDKKHVVTVNDLSEKDYLIALDKPAVAQSFNFKVIDNNIGYLDFKSMDNYGRFKKFCDSVFELADNQHIYKLMIDLRENGGGNSQLGWYLLNYITTTPFRMAGESGRKISQQFKDHITSNKAIYGEGSNDILSQPNGSFYKIGSTQLSKPENVSHPFKGKVCFLVGPYTFSSANMLAATVKDFKLATLIGEPTGEPGNDYGELCEIKLPNTGYVAFTSTTMWVRPNNNKEDNNPIYPDYTVKRSPGGNDNILKFAEKWLFDK
ncbi:MAG: S41 family peptidase [Mucilaginibacter sp.]